MEENACAVAVDALFDGFFVQHGVDGEMLADVAQEVEAVHFAEPVSVVRHNGGVSALQSSRKGLSGCGCFPPNAATVSAEFKLRSAALSWGRRS